LEKNLENTEKKLAKLQNDYDILKNEHEYLEVKLDAATEKFANAATLIKENLDLIMNGQIVSEENNDIAKKLVLDLNEIKNKPFDELDKA